MAEVVRLGDRGRLVLPARLRQLLNLESGDELAVSLSSEGGLLLLPRKAAAHALIGLAAQPGSESAVEELLRERTREANAEAADMPRRAPRARHKA